MNLTKLIATSWHLVTRVLAAMHSELVDPPNAK